jgi:hypothetical protein
MKIRFSDYSHFVETNLFTHIQYTVLAIVECPSYLIELIQVNPFQNQ